MDWIVLKSHIYWHGVMYNVVITCSKVLRVGALCAMHRAPQLLEKHMQAAAALVLGAFQEQHAGAHLNMWEMVLAFVKAYPSAWHAVDMRKAVLPRLLAFLRSHTTACTRTVCLAGKAVPICRAWHLSLSAASTASLDLVPKHWLYVLQANHGCVYSVCLASNPVPAQTCTTIQLVVHPPCFAAHSSTCLGCIAQCIALTLDTNMTASLSGALQPFSAR